MDPTASAALHGRIKSSTPHRLNRGPVKAVKHGGSGWVASEGERGRVSDRAGSGKEQFAVLEMEYGKAGGNVCKGRKN